MKNSLLFILILGTVNAFAQSGITWSPATDVAANTYGNMHPRIVVDGGGNPLVLFGSMDDNVQFTRWNGSAFTMPMPLNPSNMPAFTASWAGPDVASKGDTVYVVFKDTPEDVNHHIFIVRSFDGGVTFSAPVQVDFIADSISRFPTVAVDGSGNPVVAFMKFNPDFSNAHWVVTRSNDYGATFQPDVPASGFGGELVCDCCPGSVVADGNNVVVLYRANLNNIRDSWAAFSTDNGSTFNNSINIDQHEWMIMACPSSGPDGVVVNDTLHSVFMNGASGSNLVYENQTDLNMPTGSTAPPITGTFAGLTQQNYPRIASHHTAVAQVWRQFANGATQLALSFTDNIQIGFPTDYDTVATDHITNADVAVHDGKVYVVWQDDNSGTVKFRSGTFVLTTDGSMPLSTPSFHVYPNPTDASVTVSVNGNDKAQIVITDVTGRNIETINVVNTNTVIDTKALGNGVYIVGLQSPGNTVTRKLVVNRP